MDVQTLIEEFNQESKYKDLHWEGSFEDYLKIVEKSPTVIEDAYQRIYRLIMSYGTEEVTKHKVKLTRYTFFADPDNNGKDAVYGLDKSLMLLVSVFKSAAQHFGTEKRILLLHGPVGSAKSTVVRLLKKGLEAFSRTDEGKLYTFAWRNPEAVTCGGPEWEDCPMHDEPLLLLPRALREKFLKDLGLLKPETHNYYKTLLDGELCPSCRYQYKTMMQRHEGDLGKVLEDVRVRRLILSEKDRIGVGTFQPKDEKNQDSTELTGDINYRKIAIYGSDSDPRAFNYDGELNIANRGIVEFVELLKLDTAFLYELLGASQEHTIKPKKNPQCMVDEVIIGHTNNPDYKKLQNDEFMEALRDRTIKVDFPYVTELNEEIKVYEKDFGDTSGGKHIAPHTIEMAAMWADLTHLKDPQKPNLTLLQKLKLYNGKTLPGFTEEHVKELHDEAKGEGMDGISPRYIQDKLSNAQVSEEGACVNPFMVLKELEAGLDTHSLITSEEQRKRFKELLAVVKDEYAEIVKKEVKNAISSDEAAAKNLCSNYIDNIKAYTNKEKIRNKFTGEMEEPNEQLMRSIEEKIEIPESRKDAFREQIMMYIGNLALEGKSFDYKENERLRSAIEAKLFEDQKDTIKLTSLVSNVIDKETQEKIDVVKTRLIKVYGYCEHCATDVLQYVASIFARGDLKKE